MSNSVIDSIKRPDWTPALPCPFCGETAEIQHNEDGSWQVQCGSIYCEVYTVAGPHGQMAEAVGAWNHRGGKL